MDYTNRELRELRELIDKLNKTTKAYDEGHPIMTDKDWDDLYFKLEKKERETGIYFADSPTQSISFTTVNQLSKREHSHPMLSLDKTKDIKEIDSFLDKEWCAMFKLDGLSASLTYINGELSSAETRGNGIIGEDISHTIVGVKGVPLKIKTDKARIVVDGEIICTYPDFERFKGEFKNPRNFAAGSIRLLSGAEAKDRSLTFVAWDYIEGTDTDFFFWRLEELDELGFITVPRIGDAETPDKAVDALSNFPERDIYPIDGYVFRFESQAYYESRGRTDHHFNGAMAYKMYDDEYETELLKIEWGMGRTGVLTPVAVFKPVEIDGALVERCSLSNLSNLKKKLKKPYIGQKIKIIKSNMVIPQLTEAQDEFGKWIN